MIILIGSEGNSPDSPVAKRFGHANYYILFDTDTGTFRSVPNKEEGHDHSNLKEFLDRGVEAFIVGNIGPHAFDIINTEKSKVYLARKMNVNEAFEKCIGGELQQILKPTARRSIGRGHDH